MNLGISALMGATIRQFTYGTLLQGSRFNLG